MMCLKNHKLFESTGTQSKDSGILGDVTDQIDWGFVVKKVGEDANRFRLYYLCDGKLLSTFKESNDMAAQIEEMVERRQPVGSY